MFCTKCGTKLEEGNTQCPQCGEAVGTQENNNASAGGVTLTLPPVKLPDKSQFRSFLSFDTMITPMIMKVLYVIGSIGIIIAMLIVMFGGFSRMTAGSFFGGLFGGILMLVFYRVLCEQMLLFFTINSKLGDIRDNTTK